ncbi:uncharacterized protein LOC122086507 [Macadamia integrifolia]|uniref:uncharacterized protein LOC122086507 n=1 Tax=Macadamia integrifolia TaxID=60698 RepID=UPI001C4EFDD6|nr:uncharacterized protein LOC122086507 [Macadamia integrifolia]
MWPQIHSLVWLRLPRPCWSCRLMHQRYLACASSKLLNAPRSYIPMYYIRNLGPYTRGKKNKEEKGKETRVEKKKQKDKKRRGKRNRKEEEERKKKLLSEMKERKMLAFLAFLDQRSRHKAGLSRRIFCKYNEGFSTTMSCAATFGC